MRVAPASSSVGTISGVSERPAGAPNAWVTPVRAASVMNGHSSSGSPDRDEEQQAGNDRLGDDRHGEEPDARQAVGDLAGRQCEQWQRHELGQPDEPEVERAPVDRIDLPADGDRNHLGRKPGGEESAEQPPEVAVVKRRRQLTAGGAEERHEAELCR